MGGEPQPPARQATAGPRGPQGARPLARTGPESDPRVNTLLRGVPQGTLLGFSRTLSCVTDAAPPIPDNGSAPPAPLAAWLVLGALLCLSAGEVALALQQGPELAPEALARFLSPASLWPVLLHLGFTLLLVAISQTATYEGAAPLGWPGLRTPRAWATALSLGLLLFATLSFGLPAVAVLIWPSLMDQHPNVIAEAVPELKTLLWGVPIVIIGGGIREELWRVGLLRAFERLGGPRGLMWGALISSIAFGLLHWYQGLIAVGMTLLMGLLLAWRWQVNRDLPELMVIHSVHNVLTLVLVYFMPAT